MSQMGHDHSANEAPDRLHVHRARIADFEAVRDLFRLLDRYHADALPDVMRVPDQPRITPAELADLIACDNCFFAVAERAGTVVGFIDASVHTPEDPAEVDQPWCGVNNLAVQASSRREGIGTALMAAAEDWARTKGLADVRLRVYEFNTRALDFYEGLGYSTLARWLRKPLTP